MNRRFCSLLVTSAAVAALSAVTVPGAGSLSSMPDATRKTFFVSTAGLDTNPGTAQRPWRTIMRALRKLKPGQTALVGPGTYGRTGCQHGRGGSAAGGYVTLKASPARRAILTAKANSVLWIDCNYLRVQGFVISGPSVVGGTNVYGYVGSHDVQIVGNEIRNSICQGIFLEEQTDVWRIIRNWIHDNGHGCDEQAHGIYLQGDNHLVANNVIDRQGEGYGVHIFDYDRNPRVVNNTIVHSGSGGIVIGGSGCRSRDRCGVSGAVVANNALAYNAWYGISRVSSAPPHSCDIHSNLAYANRWGSYGGGWPSGCAGANRTGNPRFADPSGHDYHLSASSPAVGAADPRVTVSPDYDGLPRPQGRRPDIGAYERRPRTRR
jgi:hypothetical protein